MEKATFEINQYKNGQMNVFTDQVASEFPLTIFVNNVEWITLLCTPTFIKELVVGVLFTEGFIQNVQEVNEFHLDIKNGVVRVNLLKDMSLFLTLNGKRIKTTGCGNGSMAIDGTKRLAVVSSDFQLKISKIFEFSQIFNHFSPLFLETGGTHVSLLVSNQEVVQAFEDIGRHNTIDKAIGYALINNLNLSQMALFSSGRISSEMILKAIEAHIPIVMSHSAPTDQAIQFAKLYHVTLIGFIRGSRFNLYHEEQRLLNE